MLHKETVETSTDLVMMQGEFDWKVVANRLNEMTAEPKRHFRDLHF